MSESGAARRRRSAEAREKHRIQCREYYRKNYDRLYAYERARSQTPKYLAGKKLRDAVEHRRIRKPRTCQGCGSSTPARYLHGHHEDHSKPFDVRWLCTLCHGEVHRQGRAAEREAKGGERG